ncbi:MAG: ribosome maturation factor RimP [Candidatus Omnitrophica bacterium]|nr:ribosome maturation factor RimP [Candidatus Omnitrophota bacterium]
MEEKVILDKVSSLTAPLLSGAGIELVDLTYRRETGGMILRFTVDKAGGITVGECGALNRKIADILDEADPIDGPYVLEVQSPGLDRKLVKTSDFERTIGKDIFVVTYGPVENKREFTGKLKWVGEESIKLEFPTGGEVTIPRNMIAKAKLHFEF